MSDSTIYLFDADVPDDLNAPGTALEITMMDDNVYLRIVEATERFESSTYKGVSPYLTLNVHRLIKALSSAWALENPDAA